MTPFWGLGTTLEPRCHQGPKLPPNLLPPGTQKGPIRNPLDTLRANKSSKFYKKSSKRTDPKTQQEKVTIQGTSRPQKILFYFSKTHVFKDPPYPEKVCKMTPKCSPNGSQIDPMSPKGPSKASQKTKRKHRQTKTQKNNKKGKPALASEREAR